MLHTLNSTTSIVVVDKEGILTETQRTTQEICVSETISKMDKGIISKPQSEEIRDTSIKSTESKSDRSGIRNQAILKGNMEESKITKMVPSNDLVGQSVEEPNRESFDQVYCISAPSNHHHDDEHFGGRVVFDVLSRPIVPDGQRFEDIVAVRRHFKTLRPFLTLMAAAKLPLSDRQYQ